MKFTNQDVLDEINAYAKEHGISDSLRDLAKTRFITAQEEYKDTWQTWSVERHEEEARDELADYINYKVFIVLLLSRPS